MAIINRRCPPRPAAFLLFVVLTLLFPAAPAPAADREAVRSAAAEVLQDGDYQREAALASARGVAETPRSADGLDPPRPPDGRPRDSGDRDTWSPFKLPAGLQVLVWILIAAVVAFLLYRLILALPRRRRKGGAAPSATSEADAAAPRADETLQAADRLAAEGALGEAVHRLLLAAMALLRRRIGQGPAPSWTAREVLRRLDLPARARAALAVMIEAAERDRYGGRPSVPATYKACRACYLRFAAIAGGTET